MGGMYSPTSVTSIVPCFAYTSAPGLDTLADLCSRLGNESDIGILGQCRSFL